MTRKPKPVLEILFLGPGLLPESIPLGTLSQALSAVQRLASGQEVSDEEAPPEDSALRLLDVQRGSAVFRIVGPPAQVGFIRHAGRALKDPDSASDSDFIITPIDHLSRIARSLECQIVLRVPGRSVNLMKVDGNSYERIAGRMLIEGDTSFTGRVERVGGTTAQRCALRVPFQSRMIFCSVQSNELARQLGERLYEDVAVQGTATWLRGSWRIHSFVVKDVYQPKKGSIKGALKALREAGGKDWDAISNPATFLEEVSGER